MLTSNYHDLLVSEGNDISFPSSNHAATCKDNGQAITIKISSSKVLSVVTSSSYTSSPILSKENISPGQYTWFSTVFTRSNWYLVQFFIPLVTMLSL